ncbi:hypothetical protein [Ectothiorhodospira lacustris]|uniref:hypothetical protein n=1 Tax=Ectothiorhodospira lacustris TaxID=2899127 RepID=UPI001EE80395|nr:hypothetical protein [Ectothiorhodospira lacustris]MCG5500769.1 hypothetical protein [Ectothiorhodospira lacustris]
MSGKGNPEQVSCRHFREGANPECGVCRWIPAFAGMTYSEHPKVIHGKSGMTYSEHPKVIHGKSGMTYSEHPKVIHGKSGMTYSEHPKVIHGK